LIDGREEEPMGIIINNVVASIGKQRSIKRVNLRIENKVISGVSESVLPAASDFTVIDGEGKFAFPGMVNAHSHLPMSLFRGLADDLPLSSWLKDHIWPAEKKLTKEDVYWGSLLSLAEMIRSGTTMIADMYFHTDSIAKAVSEAHMRALLSYGIIADKLNTHGKGELSIARAVIDQWEGASEGLIRAAVSPHAIYTCGKDVWQATLDLAREKSVPLHTHLAETREELSWSVDNLGDTPVKALNKLGVFSAPTIAAHCVHVTTEEIEILADRKVTVVHCPKSNAKLGNGNAPVVSLQTAGVNVALGTDGAASNNSQDMIEEMRMASLLQKAYSEDPTSLPAWQVARMATTNGARALGMGANEIAIGEDADIILVNLSGVDTLPVHDPLSTLVYAGHGCDVTDVIVAGEFLLRNRELVTIDEERVRYEVAKRFRKLSTN
jgi:5-methylthioadenosine/S-adenosylhomocysteine deaminase